MMSFRRPNQKPKLLAPAVTFAFKFKMITEEEKDHILEGNMDLTKDRLKNLNAKHSTLKTGQSVRIYQGRAEKIMIDLLLDVPKEDRTK